MEQHTGGDFYEIANTMHGARDTSGRMPRAEAGTVATVMSSCYNVPNEPLSRHPSFWTTFFFRRRDSAFPAFHLKLRGSISLVGLERFLAKTEAEVIPGYGTVRSSRQIEGDARARRNKQIKSDCFRFCPSASPSSPATEEGRGGREKCLDVPCV